MAIFKSFWTGGELTPYEWLSMQSFIDYDHAYHLYTYDEALVVPYGVVKQPAEAVISEKLLFTLENGPGAGSLSIFSDWFRYELLLNNGGWWVDTDVVCLTSSIEYDPLFYAFESCGVINCAVMNFPAKHKAMQLCRDETVRLGPNPEWGDTGPKLFTKVLRDLDLIRFSMSQQTCYPVEWQDVISLYDPLMTETIELATKDSIMLHLWNETIRRAGVDKYLAPPRGSFLEMLFERHRFDFQGPARYDFESLLQMDCDRREMEARFYKSQISR